MSAITPTVDFTGSMSQNELNNQDIQNLNDELSRLQDNQDSINNTLTIIANNKITATGSTGIANAIISTSSSNMFMVFFNNSSDLTKFYSAPYYDYDVSGNIIAKVVGYSSSTGLAIQYQWPTSVTWNFYYFIIQQPANASV